MHRDSDHLPARITYPVFSMLFVQSLQILHAPIYSYIHRLMMMNMQDSGHLPAPVGGALGQELAGGGYACPRTPHRAEH